jgi:NAD(P)-dependent dehydrogenase (short-subunit alcohol dehydrogenase family)
MSSTWLITGSSRGLGNELAKAALAAGHNVVATARKPEQLAELLERHGAQVRVVPLDVTDQASAHAAVRHAIDAFGRLDVIVNNAGYGNVASIEEMDDADFRAQMETNFFGVANVTRAALPVMREQRSGHIIQVSSIGGRGGSPGLSAYQSAKWAVEGFSEVLAKEVAPLGIKVTIVEPGSFRTDWAGASMTIQAPRNEYLTSIGPMIDFRRTHQPLGDPAKAAQAILRVAGIAAPPLRLLLGSDAVRVAEQLHVTRSAEDARWRELSLSTDAEDGDARAFKASLDKLGLSAQKSDGH